MEDNSRWRWWVVAAVAPVTWGSTYYVTRHYLPPGHALWGGVLRAIPAGLLLLMASRRLPNRQELVRSVVLGTLNVGAFFALVYLAAQLLPSSIASTLMATSALVLPLVAWPLLQQRPTARRLAGAAVGLAGVAFLLLTDIDAVDGRGVAASVAAMLLSSVGYVLATRWNADAGLLASTSWQLLAGGLVLLPAALAVEGAPPRLSTAAVLGFGYVSLIATAVAYLAWFAALRHLQVGAVGAVGLLNPLTGTALGVALAGETLTPQQGAGAALVLVGILYALSRDQTPAGPAGAAKPHVSTGAEPADGSADTERLPAYLSAECKDRHNLVKVRRSTGDGRREGRK